MIFTLNDYMDYIAQTPEEFYHGLNQATIDSVWDNTTQVRIIKEEGYPFDNTFEEHEAWVSTVADVTTNTDKVIGNYINVLFRSIYHEQNYRGQKYLYKTDDVREDFYLCYDKLNKLTATSNTKLIMCNNKIKWIDVKNGAIHEEPMFVGWELTSTNNQISRDGTVPERRLICLVQGNQYTRKIKENQRFIISHNKAFKVTQIDDTNLEHIDDEYPTLLTMYIEWCPVLPVDNLELNIADYYINNYTINLSQNEISEEKGSVGKINATVKINDTIADSSILRWKSTDEDVIVVDNQGNYIIIGDPPSSAFLICYMEGNENLNVVVPVIVEDTTLQVKKLIVFPSDTVNLYQGDTLDFECGVYVGSDKQTIEVDCTPDWRDDRYFKLSKTSEGYSVLNLKMNQKPLYLKFSAEGMETVVEVKLRALF